MVNRPLVSLIIPSYNKGRWLAETLFSAFGQTYSPLEIVVYDDGSTDQSRQILQAFIGISNFKYIQSEVCSGSVAISRNRAIENASGEYIAFLDADDRLLPFHVEDIMTEAIKDPKIDWLLSNLFIIDENEKIVAGPWVPDESSILNRCSVGILCSIVKRSVLIELGGFDETIGFSEDWDLVLRLFRAGIVRKYINVTNYLGRKVFGEASISKEAGTFTPNFLNEKRIESHKYIREKHKLRGPCKCGCGAEGWVENILLTGQPEPVKVKENQTISASMIVKDEQDVLERCLKSIAGVDEIVILDTGSTDGTPGIAKKYTDKYIFGEYTWNDDFAEARNESLKRCTGDWILIIDADEQLEEGGVQRIRDLIKQVPNNVRAISFRTIAERGTLEHASVRLFRNNIGIVWAGAVHNYLSARANLASGIALRYGYSPAHAKDPDRAFRILTKVVAENPDCGRERFYLAREYYYRQKWDEAIEHYRLYLEHAHWPPEMAEAWMQVSRCYNNVKMNLEARLACLRAIDLNPDFKDALTWMAQLVELTDPTAAAKWREYAPLATNSNTLFHSME